MILINKDGTKIDVVPDKVEWLKSKGWKEEAAHESSKKQSSSKKSEKE